MGRFVLTLRAPTYYGVDTFDSDSAIWTETDVNKTETSRFTSDPVRDSVMRIKGKVWTLGDEYLLGSGLYLDDSPDGVNEGAYKDFAVTPNVRYIFTCLYKVGLGSLSIQLYDLTNAVVISTDSVTATNWSSYEKTLTIPDGCTELRVKFLQDDGPHSSPFYIDNVAFNGNCLLSDPDEYRRVPQRVGSIHRTLSGRHIYELSAIHYSFVLGWNYLSTYEYEGLRELFNTPELLYFDDGDVPPLVESETIFDSAEYNYAGITSPSSTHKAYYDSSSSLPLGRDDFQAQEFPTSGYQAVDEDDDNFFETSNPPEGHYLYQKFLIKSGIAKADARRFRCRVVAESDDSSPANLDGCILYVWDGSNWAELTRSTNSAKRDLTYSTAEPAIASRFVSAEDNYIRLLLRSVGPKSLSSPLNLRTYFVEVELNEDLDRVIALSHKAILDENGDVIYVKNLSTGQKLTLGTDYTISLDRRSVNILGQPPGSEIEVKYNRYFEVTLVDMPEEWLSGGDDKVRGIKISLRTISEER